MSVWKAAYESQMETWRWCRTDGGMRWRAGSLEIGCEGLPGPTQRLLAALYTIEEEKLLDAEPYFISREFGEVVEAAAETFEPEPILVTDFLSSSGFAYYEKPIRMPDRTGATIDFAAFSWTPIYAMDDESIENTQRALDGSYLQPDDHVAIHIGEVIPEGAVEVRALDPTGRAFTGQKIPTAEIERYMRIGVALTLYTAPDPEKWRRDYPDIWRPSRLPIHHTPWYYGMSFDGNQFDSRGVETGVSAWWRVTQTTLRLMQQRLAVTPRERADRPARREAKRHGFPEREIVVVRLRRSGGDKAAPDHQPEAANYSHRFIVSGHWRQQWYPSIQSHRQIWISPYVKGPEDQPLKISPRRVYEAIR